MSRPTDRDLRPASRETVARLLERYDRPGPRYTSYPTAVEFHDGVDAATCESRLADANLQGDEPLSFYLHLPFCHERCSFCGCHVIITPHEERARPYLEMLRQELDLVAAHLPDRRRLSQLHLGGGTPTYYAPADLRTFLEHLLQSFRPTDDAELAVEVDPRVTSHEHVDVLADLGFNRISLGVQDFTPRVQEAINRVQSYEQTASIIDYARTRGYRGINVDLIYGLPYQTPETFEETVEKVIEMGVDRSAVYSFAYVPSGRSHQTRIDTEALPAPETKLELFALARERFLAAGYEPIGMDHFARPDDELGRARREGRLRRNFQGYTVIPADDVVGLGISAIGDVRGAYLQNIKKLTDYATCVAEGRLPTVRGVVRDADDEIRRNVIHEIMCNFRVDKREVASRWGIDFDAYFAPDLERLGHHEKDGMVELGAEAIQVTPMGELFIRVLAMCFDRYWWERHEGSDRTHFSRTV